MWNEAPESMIQVFSMLMLSLEESDLVDGEEA